MILAFYNSYHQDDMQPVFIVQCSLSLIQRSYIYPSRSTKQPPTSPCHLACHVHCSSTEHIPESIHGWLVSRALLVLVLVPRCLNIKYVCSLYVSTGIYQILLKKKFKCRVGNWTAVRTLIFARHSGHRTEKPLPRYNLPAALQYQSPRVLSLTGLDK